MITVPTKYLKAALLAAGKKDIRYYLNGVLIECMPTETRCVATDGTIACALTTPAENIMPCEFIVPRDVVESAIKVKREHTTFEPQGEGKWVMNGTHLFTQVDGKFPDYRRVFTRQVSGEAGVFNPELIAAFGKMAQALGGWPGHAHFHHNGTGTAMVSICDMPEFAGCVMPLNLKAKDAPVRPGVAQWVHA